MSFESRRLKPCLALVALLPLAACGDDPERARRALDDAGFTDITLSPPGWFELNPCAESDVFRSHFTATNLRGNRVAGVVCSGWSKGATIRFD